jgi:16S rRNA (adenine1518-N6/adenine1519-N6)-dimethyltransferase
MSLLGPAEIRSLAASLGVQPTKKLGQNFVHDPNTVRRIVAAAGLGENEVVMEVGPGLGSLTLGLLEHAAHLHAVELDPVLAAALPGTVATHAPELAGRITVHHRDAMRVEPGELDPAPTALVANLPYNVAVPVVLHALATLPSLRHGLVMVQLEVAERLTAGPGSRIYGIPSVKLAWYAAAKQAGKVPPSVFWPVPNVDSGLVAFTLREPPVTTASREEVFAVVDAAFAQRRKTLRAALAGWAGSPDRAEAALRSAGIDPKTRGEQLTVTQFAAIATHRG